MLASTTHVLLNIQYTSMKLALLKLKFIFFNITNLFFKTKTEVLGDYTQSH